MQETPYSFSLGRVTVRYQFESVGPERVIQKTVVFTELETSGIYNLALLDTLANGEETDEAVSNNRDLPQVMATVLRIVEDFLTRFPEEAVLFSGNDDRRTRLYRVVITRELEALNEKFSIFGLTASGLENFQPNRIYEAFLIENRKINGDD